MARSFGNSRLQRKSEPGKILVTVNTDSEVEEVHWKANPGEEDGLGRLIAQLIKLHDKKVKVTTEEN